MGKNKEKFNSFKQEFKAFITRGNVLDMAVGVIIGGAFNSIVTALVNILMSVCTWGLPGGIKGLVTVLPATNEAQKGMDVANGLVQKFAAADLQSLAVAETEALYGTSADPQLVETVKSSILSKYTLHGNVYTYNNSSIIDWGAFINAIISFLIIALTLFVIIKVVAKLNQKRTEINSKLQEKLAKKEEKVEETPAE